MSTNYLSPASFTINVTRLPNVEFFTQKAEIPGLTASPVEMASPFGNRFETQNALSYDDLTLSFVVDENMNNYLEIFEWLKGLGSPQNFDQYSRLANSDDGTRSDISLIITNSHKNANIKVTYYNCFPISLSAIPLDVTASDISAVPADATFRYDYFEIDRI